MSMLIDYHQVYNVNLHLILAELQRQTPRLAENALPAAPCARLQNLCRTAERTFWPRMHRVCATDDTYALNNFL